MLGDVRVCAHSMITWISRGLVGGSLPVRKSREAFGLPAGTTADGDVPPVGPMGASPPGELPWIDDPPWRSRCPDSHPTGFREELEAFETSLFSLIESGVMTSCPKARFLPEIGQRPSRNGDLLSQKLKVVKNFGNLSFWTGRHGGLTWDLLCNYISCRKAPFVSRDPRSGPAPPMLHQYGIVFYRTRHRRRGFRNGWRWAWMAGLILTGLCLAGWGIWMLRLCFRS